jgi:hypothetical protein
MANDQQMRLVDPFVITSAPITLNTDSHPELGDP